LNLGRYEVVRELGKGAMGVVYLAKDPLIGRLVALKTIRIPSADDDEAQEYQQRFIREAQAAGILSHPSIVTVHDIGQDDGTGTSFIAMEYVEGLTLKEMLQQGKVLPFQEVAESMAQVAEALDYAHSKGIIHRDVKPANILFCEGNRVKITDFGIAKIASSVQNLTTTGQFIGTPNYMAPEQVKGTPVDGRTDLFSLGIVLYEWLSKRKPFGGDSLTTISYKIVHEGITPLRQIDPSIPEAFEVIVARCLEKDPKHRYQRGKDLAAALRAIARGVDQKTDPMQLEQTVAASSRLPTVELPFPDAVDGELPSSSGPLSSGSVSRQTAPVRIQRQSVDFGRIVRTAIPGWLFFTVIGVALVILAVASVNIWRQQVVVPPVDVAREKLVSQQRDLRTQGTDLLRAGDVEGAYAKFHQLLQLAPNSPAIRLIVSRLDQIRTQQQVSARRKTESQAKLTEGIRLYDARNFSAAIASFEEAFYLNPNSTEAVNYLRMSREQLSLQAVTNGGGAGTASKNGRKRKDAGAPVKPSGPLIADQTTSSVIMVVDTQLADGYVVVKIGGETVLHENLWQEPPGLIRRRVPRQLEVRREIRAGSYDVEAWLIVPKKNISDRRQYQFTFRPGDSHRMVMKADAASRKLQVTFN
jgi:serine/threonine protein kinase